MGWLQAQGIFFYSGSAHEQWTAMRASAPHPPISMAIAAQPSEAFQKLLPCMESVEGLKVVAEPPSSDGLNQSSAGHTWTSFLVKLFDLSI